MEKADKPRFRHPKRVPTPIPQSSCLLGLKEESRTASKAGTNAEAQDVRQHPVGRQVKASCQVRRGGPGPGLYPAFLAELRLGADTEQDIWRKVTLLPRSCCLWTRQLL